MENNINAKLKSILSGMGGNKLKNSADMVSEFLKTPEGRKLKDSLSESDKKAIIDKFLKLDPQSANETLKNVDLSKLGNMKADDIMRKLNQR